jgi:hypothetical protein
MPRKVHPSKREWERKAHSAITPKLRSPVSSIAARAYSRQKVTVNRRAAATVPTATEKRRVPRRETA